MSMCIEVTPKTARRQVLLRPAFPSIVCLCGSTRFGEAFHQAQLDETLAGNIVLTVGCHVHSDEALGLDPKVKAALDELHFRKIELADETLILNVGGYIGDSTGNELAYALFLSKPVRTLEPMDLAAWQTGRDRCPSPTARFWW